MWTRFPLMYTAALAVLFMGVPQAARAQNPDSVRIQTERLADGIYVLRGQGGNIGLAVGADGVFVVDDQFAPLTPKILAAIAALSDRPVRFVLNTHWHFDHTGGNENMGKAGALLVAHDNVRRRMSTGQFIEFLKREEPASPSGALPVVTFNDAVTFHLNGDDMTAIHMPAAHTDGDAAVYFRRANVVHMGDVYVRYGYPFIDLSSGGSLSGMVRGVDLVLALINDSTKVIPGHGATADRAALRTYRDMLATVRDRVHSLVTGGASLEQVLASKPTAAFDAALGGGFIKPDDFVRFAYASHPSAAPARQEPREAGAIRSARTAQNAAIRAGDIERVASFWTKDIVVLAGLGARVQGIDALKRAFAADGRIVYERLPTDVQVSANWSLAWETGTWTGKDRTANDATLITGRYSAQWVKTGDEWKIHSELFVADRCSGTACAWPLAVR